MAEEIAAWRAASGYPPQSADEPILGVTNISEEKSDDDLLLELGNLVTLDYLDKELDVQNKLQSKIDRLFKRFFQMKAMKPLMGLGQTPPPMLANETPMLELAAGDAPKILDDTLATAVTALEPIKSKEE
jgi:hypothetical protein